MNSLLEKIPRTLLWALLLALLMVPLLTRAATAVRDPYLAQAIESLPEYQYIQAGSVASVPSPITIPGQRPRVVIVRPVSLAIAPPRPAPRPVPAQGQPLTMEGEASYYSRDGCLGCNPLRIMANGQPLNDAALTMAIGADKKHLVGHQARVTSLTTGKSVMVTITDTGGFYQAKYGNRVADLTIATKQAIGMNGGVGQVRVEVY